MAALAPSLWAGQAVGALWQQPRVPPPCSRTGDASRHLAAAHTRFRSLPVGGGWDPDARELLMRALHACPTDAKIIDEVGEGLRLLREPRAALALYSQGARLGLWHHPLQRVVKDFNPGLRSSRLLGPTALEELPELHEMLLEVQGMWAALRAEFLAVRRHSKSRYVQIQLCLPSGTRCWEPWPPRWREGSWGHYYVAPTSPMDDWGEWYWDGEESKCNWAAYPQCCDLLMRLRKRGLEVTQVAVTEVQAPRTLIPAHRSQQWRLRLVCPLVVPRNSTSILRFPGFGDKVFKAGECWWFDESYEHELLYTGLSFRSALFIDVKHPGRDGRSPIGNWAASWWNYSEPMPITAKLWGSLAAMPSYVPKRRKWTLLGTTHCWLQELTPQQCCVAHPPSTCWDGEQRTFSSCCGTLPRHGAEIKRCAAAKAAQPLFRCERNEYIPSSLESDFAAKAEELTSNRTAMCARLNHDVRSSWLRQIRGCEGFSTQVFSTLCRQGQAPQLIEPLAGLLRDPRTICEGRGYAHFADWLLFAGSAPLSNVGRRIFFDVGGSRFRDAMQFFIAEYRAHGIEFDEIYVWTANKQGGEAYWKGTPEELRGAVQPRLTLFDGVLVTAEPGGVHNPVSKIFDVCQDTDFCVFKLDMDSPTSEMSLVAQILEFSRRRGPLIDELFFKHHVRGPMESLGRQGARHLAGERLEETFADSYALFSSLRTLGIRAHSWI
mmetsp:Transcript_129327/g.326536  ORF Transcript_129327/g.326536 Transcript_129327/m.326536 type:complete len:718 (-) Transcript_129327:2-2155(-)